MKTRDEIEELILENLDELNSFEPGEGHFERFEAKLKAQHNSRKINLNLFLKVAAAVVFVFLATNQAFIWFSGDGKGMFQGFKAEKEFTLASVSPEYKEVEFYYTSSINSGLNQWNNLMADGLISEAEQNAMNKELAEFETRYKSLQTDLSANPNDERVINAMLEFYKAKLEIINMIVNKLEEVKQKKAGNHENNI